MKTRRIIGLLLAVIMLVAVAVPVSANYDPSIVSPADIPANTWTLVELNHWVTRGETLEDIAARYGTRVSEIKLHNQNYFSDLANRNKTTGLDIQIEHGVKLLIYNMVRVVRYVQRGDTLESLAGGSLRRGDFRLLTTPAAIIRENQAWFDDLQRLNATRSTDHPLEESYAIFDITHAGFENGFHGQFAVPPTLAGSPLVITVPVQLSSSGTKMQYIRESFHYMANDGEIVGNPALLPGNQSQITFPNTMPTNNFPTFTATSRWFRAILGDRNASPINYKIPGLYGSTWW